MKNGILTMLVMVMLFGSNSSFSQTRTVVYPPVAQCLFELEKNFKTEAWVPVSDIQKQFIQDIYPESKELAQKVPMKTKVSDKANIINQFLEENGFQIQLNPFQKGEIGVAAIMKVGLEWKRLGRETDIEKYPAVIMDAEYSFARWNDLEIFCPATKNGDKVYMVMTSKNDIPLSDIDLYLFGVRMIKELEKSSKNYDFAEFPMIKVDQIIKLDWLLNLELHSTDPKFVPQYISQAVQQNKLAIDEKGVKVESAAATGAGPSCIPSVFTINKPFLLVIARNNQPILVGWIEQDSWKNPNK